MRKSHGFRTFGCLELALYQLTWQVARARVDPRILLTNLNCKKLGERLEDIALTT
jgi:hypothetical protein